MHHVLLNLVFNCTLFLHVRKCFVFALSFVVVLLLNIRTKDARTSAMNLGSLLLILELVAQIFEA